MEIIILIAIIALIFTIIGLEFEHENLVGISFGIFILCIFIGFLFFMMNISKNVDKKSPFKTEQLKIRQLDENLIFVIDKTSDLYKVGDTILIDTKTNQITIDPKGELCVIDAIK